MIRSVEAIIDEDGHVHLSEPIHLPKARRAIVSILEEDPQPAPVTLASEEVLARDWNRPEEDDAWRHLNQAQ